MEPQISNHFKPLCTFLLIQSCCYPCEGFSQGPSLKIWKAIIMSEDDQETSQRRVPA